jgi:putative component of toxin-antitoxin plasmid stabilization module
VDCWKLKYYRDLDSEEEPARRWLDSLKGRDEVKRLAAVAALQCVLKVHGTDVCETEWGKNLGDGLYEFRIRHPAGAIQRMFPPTKAIRKLLGKAPDDDKDANVLLRVFFTTYGAGIILLLSGYDKGRDPGSARQRGEIRNARGMAEKAKTGLRARLREEKKRAKSRR